MTDARTDDRILSISRVIRTSPEELFDAWTDPRLLLKWWGPEGTTIPDYTFDVRVGGAWKTTMMNAAGDRLVCSGVYTVLDRPRRIGLDLGLAAARRNPRPRDGGRRDFREGRRRNADDAHPKDLPESGADRVSQPGLDVELQQAGAAFRIGLRLSDTPYSRRSRRSSNGRPPGGRNRASANSRRRPTRLPI